MESVKTKEAYTRVAVKDLIHPAAATAKTYCLIGVIFSFIAALVWIILSAILSLLATIFVGLGVLAVLIAIMVYVTTYERIRTGDYAGAKGPCLVWGILGLVTGFGISGIFLILAHSKLSEISLYAPVVGPAPPRPVVPPPPVATAGSIVCFGCGSFIPAAAASCPRCGRRR